jgi:hypothetical protein
MSLMFSFQNGGHFSLLDMASFLLDKFGLRITKQSLHDRFCEASVKFLKNCLDAVLSQKIRFSGNKEALHSHFNRIRIKDSTRFALVDAFADTYKGFGGILSRSSSMISIQYEYDFLSGQSMDLRLTSGTHNDQSDSADFTDDIQEKDLFIRDLGYCTMKYLNKIHRHKAYFVNRLGSQVNLYSTKDAKDPIDLKDYLKDLVKKKLDHIEATVFLSQDHRIPVRIIISLADQATYEKRIRKTSKQARSKGNTVTEKFKAFSKLNMFVTNVPCEILKSQDVRKVYAVRWQIELIFKTWKSLVTIDEFNTKKIHRFESQLYGKLIWIMLNITLFNWIQYQIKKEQNRICSIWKYFKLIQNKSEQLIKALKSFDEFLDLIQNMVKIASPTLYLEKKKNKLSLIQIIDVLT